MYPETDIPPIIITEMELIKAEKNIPELWDDAIKEIEVKYEMNQQLAEQIFDSKYIELFENITKKIKTNPTFVASILCSTITNLERKGLDSNLLKSQEIFKLFELLEKGEIAKESIEIIFENIMSKKSRNVEEAMKNASIESINEEDLDKIIKDIVDKNQEIIKNQKDRAMGPLMGIVMKELRGKASGEIINKLLSKNIKEKLENN
jgi:glutamyl-tRNA(Gln) amidotransferase subunit E